MPGAALLLAGLLAGQPPAAATAGALQDDPAAKMALGAFVYGCLEPMSFTTSGADYAAKSTTLGAQLKAQAASFADRFRLEGAGGDSCRITYRGPNTAILWTSLTDFKTSKMNNPCEEQHPSADKAVLNCAANGANPGYVQTVERSGQGGDALLTASLAFRGRAVPGGSTAVIPPR